MVKALTFMTLYFLTSYERTVSSSAELSAVPFASPALGASGAPCVDSLPPGLSSNSAEKMPLQNLPLHDYKKSLLHGTCSVSWDGGNWCVCIRDHPPLFQGRR